MMFYSVKLIFCGKFDKIGNTSVKRKFSIFVKILQKWGLAAKDQNMIYAVS